MVKRVSGLVGFGGGTPKLSPRLRWSRIAVPTVLLAGLVARVWTVSGAPYDFHPTRQLFAMLMARNYWMSWGGEVPPGTAAAVQAAAPGLIEPPLVQGGAALLYLALGQENVAAVRVLLSLLWLTACWPLWSLLRHHLDGVAASVGVATWALLPFGVVASRSFQPDAPALALTVAAVASMLAYDASPTRGAWMRTALLSSLAVLLKLTAGFFVLPVFVLLEVTRNGPRAIRTVPVLGYVVVTVAPALAYAGLGEAFGFTAPQEGGRIVPALLTDSQFWEMWWTQSASVVGMTGVIVIAAGVLLARRRLRVVLSAYLVGYVAFGLLFTYHYMTHNYYHLPLILPWTMACGVVASAGVRMFRSNSVGRVGLAAAALCLAAFGSDVALTPAARSFWAPPPNEWTALVNASRGAGPALGHSTRVAFLAPEYGKTFEYWGYLAGPSWPSEADLYKERLAGRPRLTVDERFRQLRVAGDLEWFLIADSELTQHPDLERLLDDRYEIQRRGQGWFAYRISSH